MIKKVKSVIPLFLPLALTFTLLLGIVYVLVQQSHRTSADDPQIQLSEDIAAQLAGGTPKQYYIPSVKIDISKSLGTFILLFDDKGKMLGGSALLNGKTPELPSGVLEKTRQKGETRFTWQPERNVRIAMVITHYSRAQGGFVGIGRSLREVEVREGNLTKMVAGGWALGLLTIFLFLLLLKKIKV